MLDWVIQNALVVDGTGMPGRKADVGIRDGRISRIGKLAGEPRQQTYEAEGLVVAPGIVDVHTHYDPQITWDPLCDTAALHGVTTIAAGNCGFSVAPCRPQDREFTAQLFARVEGMGLDALSSTRWEHETFVEFLDSLQGRIGLNVGMYVGHSAIRRWVMGEDAFRRAADPGELAEMCDMLDQALRAGALGFSSSQAPTHIDSADRPCPSRLATHDELRALADVIGRYGCGTFSFAPESAAEGVSEDDREFMIELAQRSGVPVVIQGLGGRSKIDAPTQSWQEARAFLDRSADLGAPVYSLLMTRPVSGPFTLKKGTSRYEGVGLWHQMMTAPLEERRRMIADAGQRKQFRDAIDNPNKDPEIGSTLPPPHWETMTLSESGNEAHAALLGCSLADIARQWNCHPADAMFDLALGDDLDTVFHWSNESPEWRNLLVDVQRHPQMILGVSDGGAHLDRDDGQAWSTHFLAQWVREARIWRLEEAIRMITSVPAALLGLRDRGLLAAGRPADLFIFDPRTIAVKSCRLEKDGVTGEERFRAVPSGIFATMVNGRFVVENGVETEHRPGSIVRPS